jgi:N-methylhydantoinase A
MTSKSSEFLLAIDIGGTFTDLTVFDTRRHELMAVKCLTSYEDFILAVDQCMSALGLTMADAISFKHGTTLVINALLERKGARTVLLTTRGFRDVLEIARGNRALPFQMHYRKSDPLITREWRFEIDERVDAQGHVLRAPDLDELDQHIDSWKKQGVESVAISFINAYANAANEKIVQDHLRHRCPEWFITRGSGLSREWYEYERTATASANAFVGPQVGHYVQRLDQALNERRYQSGRYFMGSGSGVIDFETARAEPVRLVESGPVGGVVGAAAYAQALGLSHVVAFDIGGTTAKCALVKDAHFDVKTSYWVGGYEHGFPIRSSIIDIVEVGAGGGSIAQLDSKGRLQVGPQSAGSVPGPVAYGRGGTEPTVTDANIVLGRLAPQAQMGENMKLDVEAARLSIWERIGHPMGYVNPTQVPEIAQGLLTLISVTMSSAIRKITIERGEDPREYVLFAYGGGGPLHSVDLARELSIPKVIVPMKAGVFSALGMLFADIEAEESRTFVALLDEVQFKSAHQTCDEMAKELMKSNMRPCDKDMWQRYAELRYRGQHHTLRIAWHSQDTAQTLRQRFENAYQQRYGHVTQNAKVEFVSLHTVLRQPVEQPDLEKMAQQATAQAQSTPTVVKRQVYLGSTHQFHDVPVYQRNALPIGYTIQGPALIEEYGSTCMIDVGDRLHVGRLAELVIDVCPKV